MNEIEYKDIFSNPKTFEKFKSKRATAKEKMLGKLNPNTQAMQTIMNIVYRLRFELIPGIQKAESKYIPQLEQLAIDMIKRMYPIIDQYGFKVEVFLGENRLPEGGGGEEEEEEEYLEHPEMPTNSIINDEAAKRRIINSITQGGSVRGSLDKQFIEFLDDAPGNLLSQYREMLIDTADSVSNYGEVLKKIFGLYQDDEVLAAFLRQMEYLASGGEGEDTQGESEAEVDEDGNIVIRAAAPIFPFLIHELVKAVYEVISLKGFTKEKEISTAAVAGVDLKKYEPEDFGYGLHIEEGLEDLYNKINVRDKVPYLEFLGNLYSSLEGKDFVSFIENMINDELTTSQMNIAKEYATPESDVDLSDLGLEEIKNNIFEILYIQKLAGIITNEEYSKKLEEARFKKGTDIGKKGKGFAKISKEAAKKYGSKEAGQRVAGAILKKVLKKKGKK